MKLIPIKETFEENEEFIDHPLCQDILPMSVDYYKKIGYVAPWIGYFAQHNGKLVGSAGFKGAPVNGKIEIAYGTFEEFQNQGMGTEICKQLVEISLQTDPSVKITARTLENDSYSAKILINNHFTAVGTVIDPEDGEVWEWVYEGK
jgi:[ribosomal protein S5]-alanine N-acetyltransferase